MGWKTINGGRYYYRSEREGGRVKSTYLGPGERGNLFAQLDLIERLEREEEREAERDERREAEAEDRDVEEWFARVEAVADAAMLAAGFHRHHRGPWRRRRDGR